ncbi:Glutaredoxin arsenate reductase [bacterium HR32]|nr:Glutaredoxin arsenate reductase [bacterium HR32]
MRVLFLCTGNSARSQMAEAWLRHLSGGQVEVSSAGTEPKGLHPLAVQVMAERGIDLTGQRSKPVSEFQGQRFDWVVTVCDRARESCPVFPGARTLHWDLPDPAEVHGAQEAVLEAFRRARDELERRVGDLLKRLEGEEAPELL